MKIPIVGHNAPKGSESKTFNIKIVVIHYPSKIMLTRTGIDAGL